MRRALGRMLLEGGYADGQDWRVTRAWPSALDDPARGLVLELVGADGTVRGARLDQDGLVVAADEALPALAELVADGWTVLAHRLGKRAVLRRRGAGVFRKLATPKATRRAVARAAVVEELLTELPGVPGPPARTAVDLAAGRIDLVPAPGVGLRELLVDPATTPAVAEATGRAVGAIVARLASVGQRAEALPEHTAADEAVVIDRWVGAACALAPLAEPARSGLRVEAEAVMDELRAAEVRPTVLTHRDLHDGQILVAPDGELTVLDWDTAAWADPCLDVGNLLAHLDLLVAQQPAAAGRVAAAEAGVVAALTAGRHPALADPVRLALWRRASAVRIAAVHAFRSAPGC